MIAIWGKRPWQTVQWCYRQQLCQLFLHTCNEQSESHRNGIAHHPLGVLEGDSIDKNREPIG